MSCFVADNAIKVQAPGKLILSGEHAVVYGAPALAMAIERVVETTLGWQNERSSVLFDIANLRHKSVLTLQKLQQLKQRIQNKYNQFLHGECTIREVVQRSFELLQYAFIQIVDKFNIVLPRGLAVYTKSNIPIGCGLGSSAAIVASMLHAVKLFFGLDINVAHYLQYGRDAEKMQHGFSSGLDLYLAIYGGCQRFVDGEAERRDIPDLPMYLVNTGRPATTTGQSVSKVSKHFLNSKTLLADFTAVTNAFDEALQLNDLELVQQSVRDNHRLLIKIGVVPETVRNFISDIETLGAAAKICGAGACKGSRAGVVLVVTDKNILPITKKYGYKMFPVCGSKSGVRVV